MQNQRRINWKIIGLLALVVAAIVALSVFNNYRSTQPVRFEAENVTSAEIFDGVPGLDETRQVARLDNLSGGTRLKKNTHYYLTYQSGEGYAPGATEFTTGAEGETVVTIEPSFSDERLEGMLADERDEIRTALLAKYSTISRLYDISEGKLYKFGDWYGTTLVYKGNDAFNSDTLRVILHKNETGTWEVATDPPSISLSKYAFPDIPIDILRDINSL